MRELSEIRESGQVSLIPSIQACKGRLWTGGIRPFPPATCKRLRGLLKSDSCPSGRRAPAESVCRPSPADTPSHQQLDDRLNLARILATSPNRRGVEVGSAACLARTAKFPTEDRSQPDSQEIEIALRSNGNDAYWKYDYRKATTGYAMS